MSSASEYHDYINKFNQQEILQENYPLRQQDEDYRAEPARVDEDTMPLPKSLRWYHWLWASLPLLLVFSSAFLGFLFGLLATHWNVKILRSRQRTAVKIILLSLVLVTAVVGYYFLTYIYV